MSWRLLWRLVVTADLALLLIGLAVSPWTETLIQVALAATVIVMVLFATYVVLCLVWNRDLDDPRRSM